MVRPEKGFGNESFIGGLGKGGRVKPSFGSGYVAGFPFYKSSDPGSGFYKSEIWIPNYFVVRFISNIPNLWP